MLIRVRRGSDDRPDVHLLWSRKIPIDGCHVKLESWLRRVLLLVYGGNVLLTFLMAMGTTTVEGLLHMACGSVHSV